MYICCISIKSDTRQSSTLIPQRWQQMERRLFSFVDTGKGQSTNSCTSELSLPVLTWTVGAAVAPPPPQVKDSSLVLSESHQSSLVAVQRSWWGRWGKQTVLIQNCIMRSGRFFWCWVKNTGQTIHFHFRSIMQTGNVVLSVLSRANRFPCFSDTAESGSELFARQPLVNLQLVGICFTINGALTERFPIIMSHRLICVMSFPALTGGQRPENRHTLLHLTRGQITNRRVKPDIT